MVFFQELARFGFRSLMASSEVDQKYLGRYARIIERRDPYDAQPLYQVLGISVLLSKKLIRARRLRRLDTTRDTKSLQLYHHIIFLAREGLILLEQYIIPVVDGKKNSWEIRVLIHKLRASFYHIFVLFHNQPSIHVAAIPAFAGEGRGTGSSKQSDRSSLRRSPPPNGRGSSRPMPPGLTPVSIPKPSATFLLPARNYIPDASSYFSYASEIADAHLFGSHPIRLSVKTEYSAYLYDCLHDGEASRKVAQAAIRDVYNANETIDDEMFEDSAEMVVILGKMMKRGLNTRGAGSSSTGSKSTVTTGASTPRPASTTRPTSTSRPPSANTPRPTAKREKSPPKREEEELAKEKPTKEQLAKEELAKEKESAKEKSTKG
ncbi:uncharacterized protein KY384_002269 [Bacidia gigantensis]|uniref:uncharacterized protein n=1 Tax=Bacidia gigantensis TaxID=2732470 RepID=UPI001D04F87E|nr:uncharacterized protein KY384_002269 [Bacidia gigantensis]KAG8533486.1 hypothetical protein KY384_002269 [Bacidia gigantensis]